MDRQVLALEIDRPQTGAHRTKQSAAAPKRKRGTVKAGLRSAFSLNYGPVGRIIHDILRSAADVLDADQAFILISRDGEPAETAAALSLRPATAVALALRRAALPIRTTLRQQCVAAADSSGRELPLRNGTFAAGVSPSTLCLPLDPNSHLCGVMCLIRRSKARQLTALDLEIVHALADQAALAVGAASHQRALSRLEASLSELLPAVS